MLTRIKRFDKTAVVLFFNKPVIHEVLGSDVGRLWIALADEVDHRLQVFLADVRNPRNNSADEVIVTRR